MRHAPLVVSWLVSVVLLAACARDETRPTAATSSTPSAAASSSAAASAALPPTPWRAAAIAHAGVSTPESESDGCRKAVDAALAALDGGEEPLDAAMAGVVVLEDDPRFNAGTGSRVRLDGDTVQMDASVMDSKGRFGAVAVIERVKNPVKVARAVIDTPHVLLAGAGATRFARRLGMPDYDPATDDMRAATRELQKRLVAADPELPKKWQSFDWRSRWNFDKTLEDAGLDPTAAGTDTVGVAVRASDGRFAVALSTGGTAITLSGRVGDVPVFGAGLYAGQHGAVAATGTGERIIEFNLGRRVDEWLTSGVSPEAAAKRAVDAIHGKGSIGVIVIGASEMAALADRPMAWAGREAGSEAWLGPSP
jgi:isoaspartyl peptidase/L-asparaginase-like protein (Ntn-hydrolase superfamily)